MNLVLIAALSAIGLFLGMLAFAEIGRRIGVDRITRHPEGLSKGTGAAEAALFGLLGLMLAFSFSGAASRFEDRRDLIVEEANAVGTAYLRLDLLPAEAQPRLRDLFRRYLDARVAAHRSGQDLQSAYRKLTEAEGLQGEIWSAAIAGCKRPDAMPQAAILLLPAVNEMIDITATRGMARQNHPPLVLFVVLGLLELVGALLVGYATSANQDRAWLHTTLFAAILAMVFYIIVDLEYPRLGLIQVEAADQVLIDVRKTMR
jgi:hypothetical protein